MLNIYSRHWLSEPQMEDGIALPARERSDYSCKSGHEDRERTTADAAALAAGFDTVEKIEQCLRGERLNLPDRQTFEELAVVLSAGHERASDSMMISLVEEQLRHANGSPLTILKTCAGSSLGSTNRHYGCPWLSRKIAGLFGNRVRVTVSDAESGYNELFVDPEGGHLVVMPVMGKPAPGALCVPRLWPELEKKFGVAECCPGVMIDTLDASSLNGRHFDFIFGRHLQPGMEQLIKGSTVSKLLTETGKAVFSVDQIGGYMLITVTPDGNVHTEELPYSEKFAYYSDSVVHSLWKSQFKS